MRGLKHKYAQLAAIPACVAPHVGAWIETLFHHPLCHEPGVAPHVGAWIETRWHHNRRPCLCVAPHVGAWIETNYKKAVVLTPTSHLM